MYLDNKTFINNHFVRTGYVDVDTSFDYTCQKKFLHSPTTIFNCECHKNINFNTRSPWGERPSQNTTTDSTTNFNPRSPWGERRLRLMQKRYYWIYFNPRSPWGERPVEYTRLTISSVLISIHALREESDDIPFKYMEQDDDFNPRSPWGERHITFAILYNIVRNFNPRSPWGERLFSTLSIIIIFNFNPRSPWGERPGPH